jgi:hypothetical protein
MPVKQLDNPCWQPCAAGAKPAEDGQHWLTREDAARDADPDDTAQQFADPCWEATCDGTTGLPCGVALEDMEEGWTIHAPNAADLLGFASREGWEVAPDGTLQCAECVDRDQ